MPDLFPFQPPPPPRLGPEWSAGIVIFCWRCSGSISTCGSRATITALPVDGQCDPVSRHGGDRFDEPAPAGTLPVRSSLFYNAMSIDV